MYEKKYINLKEICEITGISYETIRNKKYGWRTWWDKYEIPFYRRGKSVVCKISDIEKVMELNRIN